MAQQNGTVPSTNGTGGATHSDESDGQTGPAGHPTQAQQNQSTSTEPLPAGYEQYCYFMLKRKLVQNTEVFNHRKLSHIVNIVESSAEDRNLW